MATIRFLLIHPRDHRSLVSQALALALCSSGHFKLSCRRAGDAHFSFKSQSLKCLFLASSKCCSLATPAPVVYCELDRHGAARKQLSKGAGFFFGGIKTGFPRSILQLYVCNYNQGGGIYQRARMKANPTSSLQECPGSWIKGKPSLCAPFHMPRCFILALAFLGRRRRPFGTFPLLLQQAFPFLIRCPLKISFSSNCTLHFCLQPGSTVGENSNSYCLDTASPRRKALLIAESPLTTEASLPGQHYCPPQGN